MKTRDVFLTARLKFVLFCGLISTGLLLAIFAITFLANTRAVKNQIADTLRDGIAMAKSDAPDTGFRSDCLIVRFGETVTFENEDGYDADVLNRMATSLRDTAGRFSESGRQFSYLGQTDENGVTVYAVYDSTTEQKYVARSGRALFLGFACGVVAIVLISWLYSYYVILPTKDAFDKQRELVANASHELKTPLTVISANMSLITAEPASTIAENERWINAVSAQVRRMNGLILEMLDLCKIEQSSPYDVKVETNLTELVSGCALCYEALCFEKGVTLDCDAEENLVVRTNAQGAEKVLNILLDNAQKYCNAGGTITITLKKRKKGAVLQVTNTGEGLSEENCKRIFERFYKADVSRGEQGEKVSFGLGLSIADAIVKQLGGSIACSSVPGESTTFTVTFGE